MLAGYLASIIESIGDYYACARISEAPVPTGKMISKGIGAEGLGCFIAGIMQTCNGHNHLFRKYWSNWINKSCKSQSYYLWCIFNAFYSHYWKNLEQFLATLPKPVVGSMFVGLFGMIASVGLSNYNW